ncbi:Ig-like domain-containing protein [Myxococcota bacterium]|nr:Ig-like domain-containing protein [Myxococcota bacterium]
MLLSLLCAVTLATPTLRVMGQARLSAEVEMDGQEAHLSGALRDDLQQPVEGALVYLQGGGQKITLRAGARGRLQARLTLPLGAHTLRLRYTGTALLLGDEIRLTARSGPATPRLRLDAPLSAPIDAPLSLRVEARSGGGQALAGLRVALAVDGRDAAAITLDARGEGRATLPPLTAGLRIITARVAADGRYAAAEARVEVEIRDQIRLHLATPRPPTPGQPLRLEGEAFGPPTAQITLRREGLILTTVAREAGAAFTLEADPLSNSLPPGLARFSLTATSAARGWAPASLSFELLIPPPPPPQPWPRWPAWALIALLGLTAWRRGRRVERPRPPAPPPPGVALASGPPPFTFTARRRQRALELRVLDALSGAPLMARVVWPVEGPPPSPSAPPPGPALTVDPRGELRLPAAVGALWVGLTGYAPQLREINGGGVAIIHLYPLRAALQRRYAALMASAAQRFGRQTPREASAAIAAAHGADLASAAALTAAMEGGLFDAVVVDEARFEALSAALDALEAGR